MNYSTLNNSLNLIPVTNAKSPTFRLREAQEKINQIQKDYLITTARSHPLKRARILLHNKTSSYHIMYIVKTLGCQEFINRSNQKLKSIEVLEGSFSLKSTGLEERVLMPNDKVIFDLSCDYEFNVLSDYLIIIEIIDHS